MICKIQLTTLVITYFLLCKENAIIYGINIMSHYYDKYNQFLRLIFFNAKKMIGALMIIISNDYRIKYLSIL